VLPHRTDYQGHPGIDSEILFDLGRPGTVREIYFYTQMGVIFDNGKKSALNDKFLKNYTRDQELETK